MTVLATRHIQGRGDYVVIDADADPGDTYVVPGARPRPGPRPFEPSGQSGGARTGCPVARLRVVSGGAFAIAKVEAYLDGVSLAGLQGREVRRARR